MNTAALFSDLCTQHRIPADRGGRLLLGEKSTRPLDRRLNAITPVSFASVGGRLVGSCYPALSHDVSAHLHRFSTEPFSAEALTALDRLLRPFLAAWGYRPAMFPARYAVSCLFPDGFCVDTSKIIDGTRLVFPEDLKNLENLTMIKPEGREEKPAFAYIADGKILACAAVNTAAEGQDCCEIGVECVKSVRGRGLGLSCVLALSDFLAKQEKTVLYQYYSANTASAVLAKKAGFVPVGAFFAYTSMQI